MTCTRLKSVTGSTKAEKIHSLIDAKFKADFIKNEIPKLSLDKQLIKMHKIKNELSEKHRQAERALQEYEKKLGLNHSTNYETKKIVFYPAYDKCFVPKHIAEELEKGKILSALGKSKEANIIFEGIIFKYKLLE